jgi:hypothetical protein
MQLLQALDREILSTQTGRNASMIKSLKAVKSSLQIAQQTAVGNFDLHAEMRKQIDMRHQFALTYDVFAEQATSEALAEFARTTARERRDEAAILSDCLRVATEDSRERPRWQRWRL